MLKVKFILEQTTKPRGGTVVAYRSTFSLTSALDGVGGQYQALAASPLGKTRYGLYRRVCGFQGPSGRHPTGIRSPGRPARSESDFVSTFPPTGWRCCRPSAWFRVSLNILPETALFNSACNDDEVKNTDKISRVPCRLWCCGLWHRVF